MASLRILFIIAGTALIVLTGCSMPGEYRRMEGSYFDPGQKKKNADPVYFTLGYAAELDIMGVTDPVSGGLAWPIGMGEAFSIGFASIPRPGNWGFGIRADIFGGEAAFADTYRITSTCFPFVLDADLSIGAGKENGPTTFLFFFGISGSWLMQDVSTTIPFGSNFITTSVSGNGFGAGAHLGFEAFVAPDISIRVKETFLYLFTKNLVNMCNRVDFGIMCYLW
ncbi:MAG: hypothetical protein HZC28_18865 [Spirochaetes bacterium]|nr:hypothetical protein [Spirochaetota bacterium]